MNENEKVYEGGSGDDTKWAWVATIADGWCRDPGHYFAPVSDDDPGGDLECVVGSRTPN